MKKYKGNPIIRQEHDSIRSFLNEDYHKGFGAIQLEVGMFLHKSGCKRLDLGFTLNSCKKIFWQQDKPYILSNSDKIIKYSVKHILTEMIKAIELYRLNKESLKYKSNSRIKVVVTNEDLTLTIKYRYLSKLKVCKKPEMSIVIHKPYFGDNLQKSDWDNKLCNIQNLCCIMLEFIKKKEKEITLW